MYDATENSSGTSSSISTPSAEPDICPVCQCEADHAHFGGQKSCNSCAAFFRRTIVFKKFYKCKANEKCIVKKDKHQRGCQACRFKKCLQIGMLADSVKSKVSNAVVAPNDEDTLGLLLKCRRSNFTNRARATLQVYGGASSYVNMSNRFKTADSCRKALRAEKLVLKQFIQSLGVTSDPALILQLTGEFMPTWIVSESVFSTVRNRGYRLRQVYYLDDSYLAYNEDAIIDYYRQYQCYWDPLIVAKSGYRLYTAVLNDSEKFHSSRIGEAEFVAIQMIFLLQLAIRLKPDAMEFRVKLNQLFKSLQKHYQENFEDITMRIDNLMINIERIQDLKQLQGEVFSMQYLNDANGDIEFQIRPIIH